VRQMLDRDLEDSEEQYQMALRSHLLIVDALVDLQYSRVKSLEETFDASLHMLEDEFDTERTEMVNAHHRQKKDLLDIMAAMDHEFTEAENEARQEYESQVFTRAPVGRQRWTPPNAWHRSGPHGACAANPGLCKTRTSSRPEMASRWHRRARVECTRPRFESAWRLACPCGADGNERLAYVWDV